LLTATVAILDTTWPYQYRVITPVDNNLTKMLDLLSEQGWEFVTARRAIGASFAGDNTGAYEVFLRRRVPLVRMWEIRVFGKDAPPDDALKP
jgi:hypothetical protein